MGRNIKRSGLHCRIDKAFWSDPDTRTDGHEIQQAADRQTDTDLHVARQVRRQRNSGRLAGRLTNRQAGSYDKMGDMTKQTKSKSMGCKSTQKPDTRSYANSGPQPDQVVNWPIDRQIGSPAHTHLDRQLGTSAGMAVNRHTYRQSRGYKQTYRR